MTRKEALEYVNNMWMSGETHDALETLIPEFGKAGSDKIMDYEKKYKEALERARANYKADKEMGFLENCDMLELIFPELAESEDERIRKELIEAFKAYDITSSWNGFPVKSILVWLEKQKEPENTSASTMAPSCWEVKQKEQKPDTRDADDLQLLGFIYDLLNEIEWKDNWAMSKDECLRRLNNYRPQKPVSISCGHENDAEWGQEDKEKIVTISEIIEHCTTIPYSGGTLTLNKEYKKELLCFIRTLRPSWKPSEEQMSYLLSLHQGGEEQKPLRELIEQLKKLKKLM